VLSCFLSFLLLLFLASAGFIACFISFGWKGRGKKRSHAINPAAKKEGKQAPQDVDGQFHKIPKLIDHQPVASFLFSFIFFSSSQQFPQEKYGNC